MKLHLAWPVSVATVALVLAGCSSGDRQHRREQCLEFAPTPRRRPRRRPSPELQKARIDYKAYAIAQTDELVGVVKVFTDAVRAGNLKAAQDAYAPSRMPWERIEPIAELVEDIDAKTDSRVDDFAGATIRSSPVGTGSSTCCSRRTPPRAARRSPTSSTRTSPT